MQSRPGYPAEALRWALAGAGADGWSTWRGHRHPDPGRAGPGHEVVPVEPDPGMRAALAAATPGTGARAAPRTIPLPDARVTRCWPGRRTTGSTGSPRTPRSPGCSRPGGTFAPIWNIRDERRRLGAPSWLASPTAATLSAT